MVRIFSLILSIVICLTLSSCSLEYGCYSMPDKKLALKNGLPYWEDGICWLPLNVAELTKDRDIIPPKTLRISPPAKTFYDKDVNAIDTPNGEVPEKFDGYRVEVSYCKSASPDIKANMFTVDYIYSEALIKKLGVEMKVEEETEIMRINGFKVYRSNPDVLLKEIAFFNDQMAIECQVQAANSKRQHELFLEFLGAVNYGRLMSFLKKHELDYGKSSAGEEDGVDRTV